MEQNGTTIQNLEFNPSIHMIFDSEATDDPNLQVYDSMAKSMFNIHTCKSNKEIILKYQWQ